MWGTTTNLHISVFYLDWFDTKPAMLFPVLALVLRRAVPDQLAFTTDLSTYRRPYCVHAPFPVRGGGALAASLPYGHVPGERDVAIDPITHLACSHASKAPAPATTLQRKNCRTVKAVPRKSDHLTVFCATRVGAA
jgi:hypothetical protein